MADSKKAFKPVVVKHVTMPTLKLVPDVPAYVKITAPIFEGKTQPVKKGETAKKAPMIFNVINLESGEVCQVPYCMATNNKEPEKWQTQKRLLSQ